VVERNPWRRVRLAILAVLVVFGAGTLGFSVIFQVGVLQALFDTVTVVSTLGYREVPDTTAEQVFIIVLILLGVSTVLYAFGVVLEAIIEGQLGDLFGRRRMERRVAAMSGHVVVCGWGRVGRAIADHLSPDVEVVVVDNDPARIAEVPYPTVLGDATDDGVLDNAGIQRCRALVAAVTSDADNLYLTLSGRTLRPDLFIVARARITSSEDKLLRAGANRVVNPQAIGGARMAAFVLQPHVTEFLDVVMHGTDVEYRLEEVTLEEGSPIAGQTLRDAHVRDRTGALVLALRGAHGGFATNPPPETVMEAGHILIAIGTTAQLTALEELVAGGQAGGAGGMPRRASAP
jgi:voltage-gated potassium channel